MKVFLSVGATYTPDQECFVSAFETFLAQNGCERLTVGRGFYDPRQPVAQARELIESAEAVVIIAFTRTVVMAAVDKPGSTEERLIKNVNYPTVWNQLEAAMAYGLGRPLLVVLEEGLREEAMLKDRHEFRTVITPLDSELFATLEFKGMFAAFKEIAMQRANATPPAKKLALDTWTLGEWLGRLRPDQLWKIGAAILTLLSAVAVGGYWAGKNF